MEAAIVDEWKWKRLGMATRMEAMGSSRGKEALWRSRGRPLEVEGRKKKKRIRISIVFLPNNSQSDFGALVLVLPRVKKSNRVQKLELRGGKTDAKLGYNEPWGTFLLMSKTVRTFHRHERHQKDVDTQYYEYWTVHIDNLVTPY